jgi:hypothetical protein
LYAGGRGARDVQILENFEASSLAKASSSQFLPEFSGIGLAELSNVASRSIFDAMLNIRCSGAMGVGLDEVKRSFVEVGHGDRHAAR